MSYHWRTIVGPAISYAHDTHRRQEFIDFCAGVEVRDDAGVWLQNDDLYCLHCGALITPNNLAFADADRNLICVDHGHNPLPKCPTNQTLKGLEVMKIFSVLNLLLCYFTAAFFSDAVFLDPFLTDWASGSTYVVFALSWLANFGAGLLIGVVWWVSSTMRDLRSVTGKGPWWAG